MELDDLDTIAKKNRGGEESEVLFKVGIKERMKYLSTIFVSSCISFILGYYSASLS